MVSATCAISACVGEDAAPGTSSSSGGGETTSSSSGGDETTSSSGTAPCSARCVGNELLACDGTKETCALGCSEEDGAHCMQIDPLGVFAPSDFTRDDLEDLDFDLDTMRIDIATGRIFRRELPDAGAPDAGRPEEIEVRAANQTAVVEEVIAGISFQVHDDGVLLRARNITIRGSGARNGISNTGGPGSGGKPLRMLAQKELQIDGVWTVPCGAVLGGHAGASAGVAGASAAATRGDGFGESGGRSGAPNNITSGVMSGGGGAGHLAKGGFGGAAGSIKGGLGGEAFSVDELASFNVLRGGAGGGAGSPQTNTPQSGGATGGGGGAAVHLVAGQRLVIGAEGPAGINVGGCGGNVTGNVASQAARHGAGGGGGAGGVLILEAPAIEARAGGLAANGGGGGGGTVGQDGQFGVFAARGGPGLSQCTGAGGNGGYGNTPSTQAGAAGNGPSSIMCNGENNTRYGGGGGGGAGRIYLRVSTGKLQRANEFFFSPELSSGLRVDDVTLR